MSRRFFYAPSKSTEPFCAIARSIALEYIFSSIGFFGQHSTMKTFFSIIVGAFFAIAVMLLVGIYWLFSVMAYGVSFLLFPLRKLLAKSQS